MANQARALVKNLDPSRFSRGGRPGIRAQLLDTTSRRLVSDFRVEGTKNSAPPNAWTREGREKGCSHNERIFSGGGRAAIRRDG